MEDRNSYRSITKSIGIFGGTKIFQILVGIVKNKIVAVLLGPFGMGITGMIMSTTQMVSAFSGLGLHTSAIRDVSQAYASGNQSLIDKTVTILRKLVFLTGILGALIVFLFADYLSQISFGNSNWTIAFQIVSNTLFIDELVVGQNVLLQGTFHYKYMAEATLASSIVGLALAVPLYFIWRIDAIVPVIVVTSLVNLVVTSFFAKKIAYHKQSLTIKDTLNGGKIMIVLGFSIALAGLVNTGQVYVVRNVLSKLGTLETVGLYTAGSTIVTQYVNVILQAMGSDYAPRLSAIANDKSLFIDTINKQSALLIVLLAPLVMLFIVFSKEFLLLLFSAKFLSIVGMIEWMMFGMLFRAISWSISFSYAALGESKIYFVNEFISSVYSLFFTLIGYNYWGFVGIGIGFSLTYILYTVQNYIICRRLFGYHFDREILVKNLLYIFLVLAFMLLMKFIANKVLFYSLGLVFIATISIVSLLQLDKMVGIKYMFNIIIQKIQKKHKFI